MEPGPDDVPDGVRNGWHGRERDRRGRAPGRRHARRPVGRRDAGHARVAPVPQGGPDARGVVGGVEHRQGGRAQAGGGGGGEAVRWA